MTEKDVVKLYEEGKSIDYIIDKYYKEARKPVKVVNTYSRSIIYIHNDTIKKSNVRGLIYNIIYNYKYKNNKNNRLKV